MDLWITIFLRSSYSPTCKIFPSFSESVAHFCVYKSIFILSCVSWIQSIKWHHISFKFFLELVAIHSWIFQIVCSNWCAHLCFSSDCFVLVLRIVTKECVRTLSLLRIRVDSWLGLPHAALLFRSHKRKECTETGVAQRVVTLRENGCD